MRMAYKRSLQCAENPDMMYHVSGNVVSSQNKLHHSAHCNHSNQGHVNTNPYSSYSMSTGLQHDSDVPMSYHPNILTTLLANSLNYQRLPSLPDRFNVSQHSVGHIHPRNNIPQNSPRLKPPPPHIQTCFPVHRISNENQHFVPPAAYVNNFPAVSTHGSYQNALQFTQGYRQHNQQIPTLHNPQTQQVPTLHNPQVPTLHNQQTQQAPPLHNQQIQQAPPLYNQQAPPLHNQQTQQVPPLHNQQTQQIPSLHNQQTQQIPSLYNQQTQQIPSLYNQQTQQVPTLHNQQTQQIPTLHNQQTQQVPTLHNQQTQQIPTLHNQQTQQVPTLHNHQNKHTPPLHNHEIPALNNQEPVSGISINNSTYTQSHQHSLEAMNRHQHYSSVSNSSNAGLTQCSQRIQQPLVNNNNNSLVEGLPLSSPVQISQKGKPIRTNTKTRKTKQSESSTQACLASITQQISTESSNLLHSGYNQSYSMLDSTQMLQKTHLAAYQNVPYNEYRDPAHFIYLDTFNRLERSSKNLLTNQESSGNDHPTIIQEISGNCNTAGVLERPGNCHPQEADHHNTNSYSLFSVVPLSESSIKVGDGSSVIDKRDNIRNGQTSSFQNTAENINQHHWYKYPETIHDSPVQSDIEAIRTDITNSASATETSSIIQLDKSSIYTRPLVQNSTESQNVCDNTTQENENQTNENTSNKEDKFGQYYTISDQFISKNNGTAALALKQVEQELNNGLCIDKTMVSNTTEYCLVVRTSSPQNISPILIDTCINTSVSSDTAININKQSSVKDNSIIINELTSRASSQQQANVSDKCQLSENNMNTTVNQTIQSSSHCLVAPAANVLEVDKRQPYYATIVNAETEKIILVLENTASSSKKMKDSKTVSDKNNWIELSSLSQDLTTSRTSINVASSDKDIDITAQKLPSRVTDTGGSICYQQKLDLSARDPSPKITSNKIASPSKQLSNHTCNVTTATSNANVVNIGVSLKSSCTLVNSALDVKTSSITPVSTVAKTVIDSQIINSSIPQDQHLTNMNNKIGHPVPVQNRRHTSPCLADRKLLENRHETHRSPAHRLPALRRSLDTQNLQSHVPSLVEQNMSKQLDSDIVQSITCETQILSAREKVFNAWKSGQVVGKTSEKSKRIGGGNKTVLKMAKQANNSTDMKKECSKSAAVKETNTEKKKQTPSTPLHISTRQGNVPSALEPIKVGKSNRSSKPPPSTVCYIMLHGHKLISVKSDTDTLILLCQFQLECFPHINIENVTSSIDHVWRIKKKPLDHPEKEKIVIFLQKNDYHLDNLIQTISLNDAKQVYHHIFGITKCTDATCVVELLDTEVDLDMVDSPSKRKTTTRDIIRMNINENCAQNNSSEENSNGSTAEEDCQEDIGDVFAAKSFDPQLSVPTSPSSIRSDTPASDSTVAYGVSIDFDEPNNKVLGETLDDPPVICWTKGAPKVGCLCNTHIGQLRCYRHNHEDFLVVDDLCTGFGSNEFHSGIKAENIILFSCCQEIANFLNSIDLKFAPLQSLQNSLVKAADIGVIHNISTQTNCYSEQNGNCYSEENGSLHLKRHLCKEEVLKEDDIISKKARLDDGTQITEPCKLNLVKQDSSVVNGEIELIVIDAPQIISDLSLTDWSKQTDVEPERVMAGKKSTDTVVQSEALDRVMAGMEMADKVVQIESSTVESNISSTVTKSSMLDLHQDTGNSLFHAQSFSIGVDPQTQQDSKHELIDIKPIPEDITVTDPESSDDTVKLFIEDDIVSVSLDSSLEVPSPLINDDINNACEVPIWISGELMESTCDADKNDGGGLNWRATDDINVMTSSSTGMLVTPKSYGKAYAKLWQRNRALIGLVDLLKKRLAVADEKTIKVTKYYEDFILDITSTYKNCDEQSMD